MKSGLLLERGGGSPERVAPAGTSTAMSPHQRLASTADMRR
eukprot:CAMPEP_0176132896 /NCGR_PEP_ID=MMETSP0120_2-20121206/67343_1 /TAXON_ID=160619 /ORGANISM="Kryptoperidinium foliaceum, Strain CCMP 1326" /LENGTH=40 /DNA_ID= /DNA_START= /DNA_END= /DNA_ORIENTATION=